MWSPENKELRPTAEHYDFLFDTFCGLLVLSRQKRSRFTKSIFIKCDSCLRYHQYKILYVFFVSRIMCYPYLIYSQREGENHQSRSKRFRTRNLLTKTFYETFQSQCGPKVSSTDFCRGMRTWFRCVER